MPKGYFHPKRCACALILFLGPAIWPPWRHVQTKQPPKERNGLGSTFSYFLFIYFFFCFFLEWAFSHSCPWRPRRRQRGRYLFSKILLPLLSCSQSGPGFQRLDSDIHFTNHYSLNNSLTNFGQTTQTAAFPIILSCVSDTFWCLVRQQDEKTGH